MNRLVGLYMHRQRFSGIKRSAQQSNCPPKKSSQTSAKKNQKCRLVGD